MNKKKKLIALSLLILSLGLVTYLIWTLNYQEEHTNNEKLDIEKLGPEYSFARDSEHIACMDSKLILMPNDYSVTPDMENMLRVIELGYILEDKVGPDRVVVIGEEHTTLTTVTKELWPNTELVTEKSEDDPEDTLYIFATNFSQNLPGEVAYVHDLMSIDVLEAHSYDEIPNLEVANTKLLQEMISFAEEKSLAFQHTLNVNPAFDSGTDFIENTTQLFGCALPGEPRDREYGFFIDFAYPEEWYLGRTEEDRYLDGYDFVSFDTAEINNTTLDKLVIWDIEGGGVDHFDFDYWR